MVVEVGHPDLSVLGDTQSASLKRGRESGIVDRRTGNYYSDMAVQNAVSSPTPQDLGSLEKGEDGFPSLAVEEQNTIGEEQPLGATDSRKGEQGTYKRYESKEDIQLLLKANPHLKSFIERLDDDKIEYIETREVKPSPSNLSAEGALMKVARAETPEEIGMHGAVMAAWTPEEDRDEEALGLFTGALFPRDALIVAKLIKSQYPQLMRETLEDCIRYQGTKFNSWSEEEPGKIAHEIRNDDDPRAKKIKQESNWEFPYYGNTDNTACFINNMVEYIADDPKNHKAETVERIVQEDGVEKKQIVTKEQALFEALECEKRHMPIYPTDEGHSDNPEGLREYKSDLERKGIRNQGWRDSGDGVSDRTGRMPNYNRGIADFATNVEEYDGFCKFKQLYPDRADEIQPYIDNLKKQIDKFWVEDKEGGYFALALDRDENGQIRQLDARTPNMGFILGSDLIKNDMKKQQAIIKNLFSPEMFNISGIRTLPLDHPLFLPDGYHNGAVWPWYNAVIAENLDILGYHGFATLLQQRVVESNVNNMFFEYNRGDDAPTPSAYFTLVKIVMLDGQEISAAQPPQPFQAWTIAANINAAAALEAKKQGKKSWSAEEGSVQQKFETPFINSIIDSPIHQEYPVAA